MNTRIISGMLFCCEEKANKVHDETEAGTVIGFVACGFFISYLIDYRTIKMSNSNQCSRFFDSISN